jgi:P-type E1-E2 ATPase
VIEIAIPGRAVFRLEHLVLDVNGTIAADGMLINGVRERVETLKDRIHIVIVTADTRGNASELKRNLQVDFHKVDAGGEDEQKLALLQSLGRECTVCVGNGSNDVSMLKDAAIGICVIGPEGAFAEAATSSDILVTGINDALDLLLHPQRLIATLRR